MAQNDYWYELKAIFQNKLSQRQLTFHEISARVSRVVAGIKE